jgi:hypothetical protein
MSAKGEEIAVEPAVAKMPSPSVTLAYGDVA